MPEFQINYIAIVVTAVINMALGFAWYGPLFGKQWLKLTGQSKESVEKVSKSGAMPKIYAIAVVGALVMSYVLAHFVQLGGMERTLGNGVMVGFWLWLGFIATTTLSSVLWEQKSWNLYALNNGYYLVLLLVNGAILSVWA